ncbi:unnamed protein product [Malus baccata var. baccata]
MVCRGRGRGRGEFSGGGGFGFAKQEPFVLFPMSFCCCSFCICLADIVLPIPKGISHLQQKKSAVIEEENLINQTRKQNKDVEIYSDITKPKTRIRRDSLFSIFKVQQPIRKRVRWNPNSGLVKLDLFEKLEQHQKEGEGEDEDENEEVEEQEEDFSDDDYDKDHVWENKMILINLWSCRALMLMMMKMIIIWKMMMKMTVTV